MGCCAGFVGGNIGRLVILIWYLVSSGRWEHTFSVFWWPLLGALFAPWTTLAYVLVYPGGVLGWDWALIVVAVLADVTSLGSSSRAGRGRRKGPSREKRWGWSDR
jgi:hypothetical protein